ncbi:MAG TPA: hypothetical protein VGR56_07790 [Nitrososphaerales archaeon]|nr:hypothetical protein [Nitrososphaerales archaeon]
MWLYEVGNLLSLSATGVQTSIILVGILPVGVMGDTPVGLGFPVAKLLQVGICVGVTLTAYAAVRRRSLPLTGFTLVVIMSMCIASVYWEMFSLTSFVPMAIHEAIYAALSVGLTFALLRVSPVVPLSKRQTKLL